MKNLEIQVTSNGIEESIILTSNYKNELNVFVNGAKVYSEENRKTVYGTNRFKHNSKCYILSLNEGAMIPIGKVDIDGDDVDFEIISCDSLIDDFRNSIFNIQDLSQLFLIFGIFTFTRQSKGLLGGIEMTSNGWLFLVLAILSIVTGIGLKKNKVWGWWLASTTSFTMCLFITERAINDISKLNVIFGLFFVLLLVLNNKRVLFQFNLEKVSSIWRILIPSLCSLIGLYAMVWS